jgi:hypothetical protein
VFVAFGPDVCLRAIVFAFGLGINESSSSVKKKKQKGNLNFYLKTLHNT